LQIQLRQLTASVNLINNLGGGWGVSDLGQTEAMAKHPPEAGKNPLIPAENSGVVPNPPTMPPGEAPPDDFMKQINDTVAPPSPNGP
jgi:hypothetical protein